MSDDRRSGSRPNPSILAAMREVEEAAGKATLRPWFVEPEKVDESTYRNACVFDENDECIAEVYGANDAANLIVQAANHAPGIIAFAQRLLEVARAAQRYQALRIEGCSDTTDEWIELSRKIDALERDYPGVLKDKRDA